MSRNTKLTIVLILLLVAVYCRIFFTPWGRFYFFQADSLITSHFLKSIFVFKESPIHYIPGLNTFLFEFLVAIVLFCFSLFNLKVYMLLQIAFNFLALYFLTKTLGKYIFLSKNKANFRNSLQAAFKARIFATIVRIIVVLFSYIDPSDVSVNEANFKQSIFVMPYFFSGWYYGTALGTLICLILFYKFRSSLTPKRIAIFTIITCLFLFSNPIFIFSFSIPSIIFIYIKNENKSFLTTQVPIFLYAAFFIILKVVNIPTLNSYMTHYSSKEPFSEFFKNIIKIHSTNNFIIQAVLIIFLLSLNIFMAKKSSFCLFVVLSFSVTLIVQIGTKSYQDKYMIIPIVLLCLGSSYFLTTQTRVISPLCNLSLVLVPIICLMGYFFDGKTLLSNNLYVKFDDFKNCQITGNSLGNYWSQTSYDTWYGTKNNRFLSTKLEKNSFEKRLLWENLDSSKLNINAIIVSNDGISKPPKPTKILKCNNMVIYYYKSGTKGYKTINSKYHQ